jgi:hypothetical protein
LDIIVFIIYAPVPSAASIFFFAFGAENFSQPPRNPFLPKATIQDEYFQCKIRTIGKQEMHPGGLPYWRKRK